MSILGGNAARVEAIPRPGARTLQFVSLGVQANEGWLPGGQEWELIDELKKAWRDGTSHLLFARGACG
jgi:hypothetical protein